MLTTLMRKECGGPFIDEAAHLEYIKKNIAAKKRMGRW